MTSKKTALGGSMPARVRNRREAKAISGADLARRIGVSPAYVSQIEKGIRVPDIPVAMRIANALDDDAWTRLYRSDRFEDDALFGRAVRSGEDIPPARGKEMALHALRNEPMAAMGAPHFDASEGPAAPMPRGAPAPRPARAREEGRPLVTAPVLEPGRDPGERDEVPGQLRIDSMVIDPRLLHGARLGRPFVFRADEEVSRRVRDRVAPGDLVIVSRDLEDGAPVPGRVYAMRHGGRVFLARLARFGEKFLVQPGPGETEMVDVGLVAGGPAKPPVAGEVVGVLKTGAP